MSREVKRVPLDLEYTLSEVWKGYNNPYGDQASKCEACNGSGGSPEVEGLKDFWYGRTEGFIPEARGSLPYSPMHPIIMSRAMKNVTRTPSYYGVDNDAVYREAVRLSTIFNSQWCHHLNADDVAALLASDRLVDLTHTWTKETGWVKKVPAVIPTPYEVNEWSLTSFGHDSLNSWIVIKAEAVRLGLPQYCEFCQGNGDIWTSEEAHNNYINWERIEPPIGEGYQMWETVSEGSPISPVFDTPEKLAEYMQGCKHNQGLSYASWLAFIKEIGSSISLVGTSEGVLDGVEAAVKYYNEEATYLEKIP